MELEVELQGKITSAAQRLASDKTVSKLVRKQRRQSYTKAVGKVSLIIYYNMKELRCPFDI